MKPARPPEVALVRSVLVTITAVAAYILGRDVSTEWISTVTTVYALAAPIISGWWTRGAVRPTVERALPRPSEYVGRHRRQGPGDA